MSAATDALIDRVVRLSGRRYSAADVLATAPASQDRLTNLHQKTDLRLCSESGGQGRARQYCLIDVYQIHLFTTLVRLTGDAKFSAEALNLLMFEEMEMKVLGAGGGGAWAAKHADFKNSLCDDIKRAPPLYWKRETFRPVFLYVDVDSRHYGPMALTIVDTSDRQLGSEFLHGFEGLQSISAASIINVTKRLDGIDDILETRLSERDAG